MVESSVSLYFPLLIPSWIDHFLTFIDVGLTWQDNNMGNLCHRKEQQDPDPKQIAKDFEGVIFSVVDVVTKPIN